MDDKEDLIAIFEEGAAALRTGDLHELWLNPYLGPLAIAKRQSKPTEVWRRKADAWDDGWLYQAEKFRKDRDPKGDT